MDSNRQGLEDLELENLQHVYSNERDPRGRELGGEASDHEKETGEVEEALRDSEPAADGSGQREVEPS